jgi:hypothetical protein
MPDRVPLFGLEWSTREEFVSLFKGRGVEWNRLRYWADVELRMIQGGYLI